MSTTNPTNPTRTTRNQKWTLEACVAEAKKHGSVTAWHNKGAGSYRKAKQKNDDGWFDRCTAHMTAPEREKKPYKWTFDKCYAEAKKYTRKVDFLEGSPSAYRSAERYNWMEACTDHMDKRTYWTEALCLKEAARHSSTGKWQENGKGSYRFAKNVGEDFYQTCCGKIRS